MSGFGFDPVGSRLFADISSNQAAIERVFMVSKNRTEKQNIAVKRNETKRVARVCEAAFKKRERRAILFQGDNQTKIVYDAFEELFPDKAFDFSMAKKYAMQLRMYGVELENKEYKTDEEKLRDLNKVRDKAREMLKKDEEFSVPVVQKRNATTCSSLSDDIETDDIINRYIRRVVLGENPLEDEEQNLEDKIRKRRALRPYLPIDLMPQVEDLAKYVRDLPTVEGKDRVFGSFIRMMDLFFIMCGWQQEGYMEKTRVELIAPKHLQDQI